MEWTIDLSPQMNILPNKSICRLSALNYNLILIIYDYLGWYSLKYGILKTNRKLSQLYLNNSKRYYKSFLISGSGDNTIKIWSNTNSNTNIKNTHYKLVKTLNPNNNWIISICNLHNSLFAAASMDKNIRIFDIDNNFKCIKKIKAHKKSISSVSNINDFCFASASSKDNTIKIWSKINWECIEAIRFKDISLGFLCYDDNMGRLWIMSGSYDSTIKVWTGDYHKGFIIDNFNNAKNTKDLKGHSEAVFSLCVINSKNFEYKIDSYDENFENSENFNKIRVVSGSVDCNIKVWEISYKNSKNDDSNIVYKCIQTLYGHTNCVFSLCDLGKDMFASGCDDGIINIWNLENTVIDNGVERNYICITSLKAHNSTIMSISRLNYYSDSDDEIIGFASSSSDETINIWYRSNNDTYKQFDCIQTLNEHKGHVLSICEI